MAAKTAVVTLTMGDGFKSMAEITHPTLKAYADKIGAEFIVIDQPKYHKTYPQYEKFQLYDLLAKYARIIYLDTDTIVRPDCPDLFKEVPEHCLGIFNEGRFMNLMGVIRDACMKFKVSIPKYQGESYNTGVMVLSRLHRSIFKYPGREFDVYDTGEGHGVYHFEQPYINTQIIANAYKVQELSYKFNRMSFLDKLTGEHRLSSYIVHYANAIPPKERLAVIEKDLAEWKEPYKYPRNIHINVGGGLGDQIDAEPVIRYIAEKAYTGDNIRVRTDFPELFGHLPVKIISQSEHIKLQRTDPTIYYTMETLPSPESPLWQFLAQTLCHTTDFASISTLRRILSNDEKQIKLQVNPEEDLTTVLNGTDPKDLVLVHPGRGWASKTFPPEYWQAIIDGLHAKGLPIAVIGRYLSTEQGLVDITVPEGVLDLRNMFSLSELIALISKARVIVSNDSAPIHIAGAFNNWIVLLPSCKHPDHVLPFREGKQNHKSVSLYRKLTCDAIDSTPTQIHGQTIDYVVGDIQEYLEDPGRVAEVVREIYSEEKTSYRE